MSRIYSNTLSDGLSLVTAQINRFRAKKPKVELHISQILNGLFKPPANRITSKHTAVVQYAAQEWFTTEGD